MSDRADAIAQFIAHAGWAKASRVFLAGDASPRRYDRLTLGQKTAVLMDAPPDRGEDIRPFALMARHLSGLGLSAPAILAQDEPQGFMLLEDLGDGLFARVLQRDATAEPQLYYAAAQVLAHLQTAPPPPGLPAHTHEFMATAAGLSITWYARAITGQTADPAPIVGAVADVLTQYCTADPVLVLRDYHAENLLWLPDRDGVARVGLLDFQMGSMGHPGYDLISLLQDARRDVSPQLQAPIIAQFAALTGQDPAGLSTACAVLGAQRALRILGAFARLSLHFGKPGYVPLIPRVWAHLHRNLAHPALADLATSVARHVPPPTPQALDRITKQCGTIPNL